jgi:hypothetical protein
MIHGPIKATKTSTAKKSTRQRARKVVSLRKKQRRGHDTKHPILTTVQAIPMTRPSGLIFGPPARWKEMKVMAKSNIDSMLQQARKVTEPISGFRTTGHVASLITKTIGR